MTGRSPELDRLCIDTIRTLSIDAIERANSGHPGLPLGAAPMAWALWRRLHRHAPKSPHWPDRDRFVLSAGHGSMLLYSLLHLTGYELSMDDIQGFRQWGSRTPGHPEFGHTAGVEATTGPLGQGSANSVGMALAERYLAHHFNRPGHSVVDHRTWALVSDGDLMEGLNYEATSLAGHLGLGKLSWIYDSNDITLDGPAQLSFTGEDVRGRFEALGWHVQQVDDGDHDVDGIERALEAAVAEEGKPSLVIVKTTIGYGSPNKAGKSDAHGAPLGEDELAATKCELGWPHTEPFTVPDEVAVHMGAATQRGEELVADWEQRFAAYREAHPELAEQFERAQRGELPDGWDENLPTWGKGDELATRVAGGETLQALARNIPWLIGGDADLGSSTKTYIKGRDAFTADGGTGPNLHFGVREHAMGAIVNGMLYHGGVRPFCSTFFVFSDYMRPAVRLAALSQLPAIYVWTHDSVAVGEDGPTHEPVEHLASLRAMPGLFTFRPGDANEAREAWRCALQRHEGPTALVLSRQGLPVIGEAGRAEDVARGGYVLRDSDGPAQVLLLATGSELHLAVQAHEQLAGDGIASRVVSLPCVELFAQQPAEYRDAVLPPAASARVSIEAGATFGWERWVGREGIALGIDRFGASAPGGQVLDELGMNVAAVVQAARRLVDRRARGGEG